MLAGSGRRSVRMSSSASSAEQGLLDGVRLRGHAGQRQLRRQRSGEAAHPSGHVQRRGPGDGVGVAGREDEDCADSERETRLLAGHPPQPRPGGDGTEQRRLTVLMGEWSCGQPRAEPGGDLVTEDQRGQRFSPRAFQPFGAGQRRRQHLHRALAGHVAMPLAELDRPPRQSVEQRRRTRIRRRPARRVDGRALTTGGGQARPRAGHLGLHRASENHAQRVEQHELGVLPNRRGDRLPRRACDEVRQLLDCLAHHALRCPE